jgi:hypothetical protein
VHVCMEYVSDLDSSLCMQYVHGAGYFVCAFGCVAHVRTCMDL